MQITDFHARYYAYVLSGQRTDNSIDMLAAILQDSKVDLNPHQVEAALFAFNSPFSRGVILADEVGLGKTIEAGIVIAQKSAEEKRKILIVVPSNLRRQWQIELEEKFYLSSVILDGESFKAYLNADVSNPFEQDQIIITSYNFAHAKAEYIKRISWDMAVIDEAHRLRNAFKDENIIARSIRDSLGDCFKLLLTATPLQNSLLELYGLISFIDDYTFGDLESFKTQFSFLRDDKNNTYDDLAQRLKSKCIRTLRRQVVEYIKYTERLPITQEFLPTPKEQEFYDKFSNYMHRDKLWALSNSGRQLITMILWKLLSSSTFAIAGTLETLILRLEAMLASGYNKTHLKVKNYEKEDYSDYDDSENPTPKDSHKKLTEQEKLSLKAEIDELKGYCVLAKSITKNAKGNALLVALEKGFAKLKELKAPQKAVIFTESRRTQEYIYNIFQKSKWANKIVLFHGGLNTADKRQKAIDDFKDKGQIFIATEAAAEGLNLQFCSMVINYDLPFNPQRIEQRIGRLHRYGQKNDVVVINFLNKNNLADQRIYELLCDKFQLFKGVFGASDSVLGTLDALDFEKRIIDIYQKCRTADEIEKSFQALRDSLSPQIDEEMQNIKKKLLENFDEEVAARLKINLKDSKYFVDKFENMLWEMARHELAGKAEFDDENKFFHLIKNPYYTSRYGYKRYGGNYYLDKNADISERFRMKCSLAQTLLNDLINNSIYSYGIVNFDLSNFKGKFSNLEKFKGKSGYLTLYKAEIIYSTRREFRLVFAGYCEDGSILDQKQMQRMFELSGEKSSYKLEEIQQIKPKLDELLKAEQDKIIREISIENNRYFDTESQKLEKWAKDIKLGMELTLRELDKNIAEIIQKSKAQMPIKDKLSLQEQLRDKERKRGELRMKIYTEQDEIDTQRKKMIEETKKKLTQKVENKHIFTIKWRVV